VITGEYPPAPGGVSDYTRVVAEALAEAGESVHVWCPGDILAASVERGVTVHRSLGTIDPAGLRRAAAHLDALPAPRRLLVQWVPHAFGRRSMNVGFCRWVARRAAAGDRVDLMVHEPFLPVTLHPGRFAVAMVHRLMAMQLLRAAARVFVATPAWTPMLRPYAAGRTVPFTWLPEPASVPVIAAPDARFRADLRVGCSTLIGSFSCHSPYARRMLTDVVPRVLAGSPSAALCLVGAGSVETRDDLVTRSPELAPRIRASGTIDAAAVSHYLSACDVAVQPYVDGICTRHSSAMTVLAHGLPTVTTEGRFTEDVWRGGQPVVLASDSAAMAAALTRLIASPGERETLRRRALDLYDSRCDVRHTVAALLAGAAVEG
jgi:glycosyltransferase involved in cell wall biosynthesis